MPCIDRPISYSFNETESLCKLAIRGIGYPWSVATRGAWAVRWLAEHDLPGVLLLGDWLARFDNVDSSTIKPSEGSVADMRCWHAESTVLCPILAGLTLLDFSSACFKNEKLQLTDVYCPGLILPFAVRLSRDLNMHLRVCWNLSAYVCDQGQLLYDQTGNVPKPRQSALTKSLLGCVSVSVHDDRDVRHAPSIDRAAERHKLAACVDRSFIQESLVDRLQAYAARTYAPSTESSRQSGAGAGLSDND